jgi:hypothetical protein
MKKTHLILILIILVLSIRFTIVEAVHASPSVKPSVSLTTPIVVPTTTIEDASIKAETDEIAPWLITDEESRWFADEIDILQRVLLDTISALEANGIDGKALLDGYRFRHDSGRYVDDVEGRMGKIDHNVGVITLSDTAFTVLQGFAIYHELGHAVDYRLDRQLSEGFHSHTGGPLNNGDDIQWQTADNYWLRLNGRDDREEATADAFAFLVMVDHAGLKRPIFANQPVTTDYDGISAALTLALRNSELILPE